MEPLDGRPEGDDLLVLSDSQGAGEGGAPASRRGDAGPLQIEVVSDVAEDAAGFF
jgi:hypothetical protein